MRTANAITWVVRGLYDASRHLAPQEWTPTDQARRTKRQKQGLAEGRHPLTRGPLHPDAAPHDDRSAPGARCGSCRLRQPGQDPKCHLRNADGQRPYVKRSNATDVRAWWPACVHYQQSEQEQ